MYHIKDDKRVKKSAELICGGLLECLKTKDFSDVTVTDVLKASTVGRATFYRLFDQLTDVLSYMLDNVFLNISDIPYDSRFSVQDQLLEPSLELWMKNADLLRIIMDAGRSDMIYDSSRRIITRFKDVFDSALDDEYLKEYFIGIASSTLIGILGTWIKNGRKETAAELMAIYRKYLQLLHNINNNNNIEKNPYTNIQ